MRQAKMTAEEIVQAEQAVDNRRQSRAKGYRMMDVRDAGWARMSNGVKILWPVDVKFEDRVEGEVWRAVPEGKFILVLPDRSELLFDAEEFRRHLRWV